ncbi:helix-turn-helix domain-containing protein [Prevotella sp. KH2C16]|uniref:helix-turn-helix domain-containing protein n=1 Tax=Prevotella sp. KH2C16 TaxID=1855325 RepID=UPI0008F0B58C|nr:helix-turn-helix transcriptional regulator [Prevotella sp. KH2C16]SFF90401.1 Transcriptional regulator, contains XRE-family HTH domain [Prevotella sp. KH2C16]
MKQLHKILKEKREHKAYSQEYVAEKLKVSSSTISRWEAGTVSMSIVQICNFAKVLGMDESDLLASIARKRQVKPLPLAQLIIDVFDRDTYNSVIDLVKDLGPQHIVVHTKL